MKNYGWLVIAAGLLWVTQAHGAPEPWQKLQSPAAAQVSSVWQSPPPEYGPEPYYGLNGPVTLETAERDLDTMKKLGFQAVTVQWGFNTPFQYLSPQYFAFFRQFVEQAKMRNMRVWIVDDAGYPSGFAGGLFTTKARALRMQALEVTQEIPVRGGATLHRVLPADTVSAAAVGVEGSAIPLPLHDGVLDWKAPPGIWTVLIVDHEFRTSPTRSDTNPRRVKDTEQSLEDYLNPAATEQFLNFTHRQYKKYVGDEFGKTIMGFRGDEPDYSIAGLPWTPAFFARFRAMKGYDVQPYTALFAQSPSRTDPGVAIHLSDEQLRIKGDYYDVFSRLFEDGFFKPQGMWCAANGLEYQVHLNHEERQMELTHSEGSFFRDMRYVQVPGIDAIWHQIWMDTISDYPRLAGSAAHLYGKPRAFTESFAAYFPRPDAAQARYILNEQFVRGVNLVEMMYFPATSAGPRPPSSLMGEPGFPELVTYVRRMSYLMSMGRPDATVGLYLPSSSMWLGDEAANRQFLSAERMLSDHQIDFDIVSEDALARDLIASRGYFQTLSGNRFRAILLPDVEIISDAALERLRAFAAGGGKVIFLGDTPRWIAGRNMRDARPARLADFNWAKVFDVQLQTTPVPGMSPPSAPPKPLAVDRAVLSEVLAAAPPTVRTLEPEPSLRVLSRRWKDAEVYLLFNEGDASVDTTASIRSQGIKAERWNPQTASITPIAATRHGSALSFHIHLAPYETTVVVVRSAANQGRESRPQR
jgi:alpha-L-rhamnosidase